MSRPSIESIVDKFGHQFELGDHVRHADGSMNLVVELDLEGTYSVGIVNLDDIDWCYPEDCEIIPSSPIQLAREAVIAAVREWNKAYEAYEFDDDQQVTTRLNLSRALQALVKLEQTP